MAEDNKALMKKALKDIAEQLNAVQASVSEFEKLVDKFEAAGEPEKVSEDAAADPTEKSEATSWLEKAKQKAEGLKEQAESATSKGGFMAGKLDAIKEKAEALKDQASAMTAKEPSAEGEAGDVEAEASEATEALKNEPEVEAEPEQEQEPKKAASSWLDKAKQKAEALKEQASELTKKPPEDE